MFTQGFTVSGSSLRLLKPGEQGIVNRLKSMDDSTLQKLRAIGIAPGTTISLEQRFPRFIIRVGSDRLAIDERTIDAIYVRVNSHKAAAAQAPKTTTSQHHPVSMAVSRR